MKIQLTSKDGTIITSGNIADDNPSGDHPKRKQRKLDVLCKKLSKLNDVEKCEIVDGVKL